MHGEHRFTAVALALAMGCSDSGPEARTSAADAGVSTPDARTAAPGSELDVTIGPVSVPPGHEETVCVVLDLGNDAPAMVRSLRTRLSPGTHHVIATLADGDQPTEDPFSCGAFAGGGPGANMLFIAQQPEASLIYPSGTGLALDAHQLVHLEMHLFNYLDDPDAEISATVTFELADDDGTQLVPVEMMFTGGTSLFLPAQSPASASSFHSVPPGANVFALTSHTHQYGTRSAIYRATSGADAAAELLHESLDWAEPPLDTYEPLSFEPNEGLLLTCDYLNTSDQDVTFGVGFEDEMCFLWAHYFVAN